MRIGGGSGFLQYPSYDSSKYKVTNKGKIKADPTEEQLAFIKEEQIKEAQALKDDSFLVPIDWDHVKETINLSPEQLKLRGEQDIKDLHDKFDLYMDDMEAVYQANMAMIDEQGEANQKEIDGQNKAKAAMIISNILRGVMVNPMDVAFARDVSPEELQKALQEAEKLKNEKGHDMSYILQMLSSIDIKG